MPTASSSAAVAEISAGTPMRSHRAIATPTIPAANPAHITSSVNSIRATFTLRIDALGSRLVVMPSSSQQPTTSTSAPILNSVSPVLSKTGEAIFAAIALAVVSLLLWGVMGWNVPYTDAAATLVSDTLLVAVVVVALDGLRSARTLSKADRWFGRYTLPALIVLGVAALAANFALVAFGQSVTDAARAWTWNLVLVVTFNLLIVLAAALATTVRNLAAAPDAETPAETPAPVAAPTRKTPRRKKKR